MTSVRKMSLCKYSIPKLHCCTFTTAFTKLATYSASVINFNFRNFWGYKSLVLLGGYAPDRC